MNLVIIILEVVVDHGSTFDISFLNDLNLATTFTDMRRLTRLSFSETVTVLCRLV